MKFSMPKMLKKMLIQMQNETNILALLALNIESQNALNCSGLVSPMKSYANFQRTVIAWACEAEQFFSLRIADAIYQLQKMQKDCLEVDYLKNFVVYELDNEVKAIF